MESTLGQGYTLLDEAPAPKSDLGNGYKLLDEPGTSALPAAKVAPAPATTGPQILAEEKPVPPPRGLINSQLSRPASDLRGESDELHVGDVPLGGFLPKSVASQQVPENLPMRAYKEFSDIIYGGLGIQPKKGQSDLEGAVNGFLRAATTFSTPEGVATMLAGAGLVKMLPELGNIPQIQAALKSSPTLAKGFDMAANAAVPGVFAGLGAKGAVQSGIQAYSQLEQGNREGAVQSGSEALANSIIAGFAGYHARKLALEAGADFPTAEQRVGNIPTGASQYAGRLAENLETQGRGLAAEQWRRVAENNPIDLGGGLTLVAERLRSGERPYYAVIDKDGNTVRGGTQDFVQSWLIQQGTAGKLALGRESVTAGAGGTPSQTTIPLEDTVRETAPASKTPAGASPDLGNGYKLLDEPVSAGLPPEPSQPAPPSAAPQPVQTAPASNSERPFEKNQVIESPEGRKFEFQRYVGDQVIYKEVLPDGTSKAGIKPLAQFKELVGYLPQAAPAIPANSSPVAPEAGVAGPEGTPVAPPQPSGIESQGVSAKSGSGENSPERKPQTPGGTVLYRSDANSPRTGQPGYWATPSRSYAAGVGNEKPGNIETLSLPSDARVLDLSKKRGYTPDEAIAALRHAFPQASERELSSLIDRDLWIPEDRQHYDIPDLIHTTEEQPAPLLAKLLQQHGYDAAKFQEPLRGSDMAHEGGVQRGRAPTYFIRSSESSAQQSAAAPPAPPQQPVAASPTTGLPQEQGGETAGIPPQKDVGVNLPNADQAAQNGERPVATEAGATGPEGGAPPKRETISEQVARERKEKREAQKQAEEAAAKARNLAKANDIRERFKGQEPQNSTFWPEVRDQFRSWDDLVEEYAKYAQEGQLDAQPLSIKDFAIDLAERRSAAGAEAGAAAPEGAAVSTPPAKRQTTEEFLNSPISGLTLDQLQARKEKLSELGRRTEGPKAYAAIQHRADQTEAAIEGHRVAALDYFQIGDRVTFPTLFGSTVTGTVEKIHDGHDMIVPGVKSRATLSVRMEKEEGGKNANVVIGGMAGVDPLAAKKVTTQASGTQPDTAQKDSIPKEGDKVSWTATNGQALTGTVRSIDEQDGTASIDTDQIKHIAGRIPIGRIETVPFGQLTFPGSETTPGPAPAPTVRTPGTSAPVPQGLAWKQPLTNKEFATPEEYYDAMRMRQRHDVEFIGSEQKQLAATNGKKGAAELRRDISSKVSKAREAYGRRQLAVELELGVKAAAQMRAEVEDRRQPETVQVPAKENYSRFWDTLDYGDTIQAPQGPIEITKADAMVMQPVIPGGPGGKWGAIGAGHRTVMTVEGRMPDGKIQKFDKQQMERHLGLGGAPQQPVVAPGSTGLPPAQGGGTASVPPQNAPQPSKMQESLQESLLKALQQVNRLRKQAIESKSPSQKAAFERQALQFEKQAQSIQKAIDHIAKQPAVGSNAEPTWAIRTIRGHVDSIVKEIEAGDRALQHTPENAFVHAEKLDRLIATGRDYANKLPAPEGEKKGLDSALAAAEAAAKRFRAAKTAPLAAARPQASTASEAGTAVIAQSAAETQGLKPEDIIKAAQAALAAEFGTPEPAPATKGFRFVVKAHGEKDFTGNNAQVFATEAEAKKAAEELFSRWMGMDAYKVEPADEAPNYRFNDEKYRSEPIEKPAPPAAPASRAPLGPEAETALEIRRNLPEVAADLASARDLVEAVNSSEILPGNKRMEAFGLDPGDSLSETHTDQLWKELEDLGAKYGYTFNWTVARGFPDLSPEDRDELKDYEIEESRDDAYLYSFRPDLLKDIVPAITNWRDGMYETLAAVEPGGLVAEHGGKGLAGEWKVPGAGQPAAPKKQQAAPKPAPAPAPAPKPPAANVGKLDAAADAALARLRKKAQGFQAQAGIDPQDLIDLTTVGARFFVKGFPKWIDWVQQMMQALGDLIKEFAKATKRTVDAMLREIHSYATPTARNFGVESEAPPASRPGFETAVEDLIGDHDLAYSRSNELMHSASADVQEKIANLNTLRRYVAESRAYGNDRVPQYLRDDLKASLDRNDALVAKWEPRLKQPQPPPAPNDESKLIPEAQKLIEGFRSLIRNGSWSIDNNVHLMDYVKQITGRSPADGSIDTKQVYDLLETAVNQEIAENGRHLMQASTVPGALQELRNMLDRLPTQAIRSDEQIRFQQFSTPPTEALVAARVLGITKDDLVLEPSAGTGGLAAFARAAGATVLTNEITPRRAALLGMSGYNVTQGDAEQIDNAYDEAYPDYPDPTAVLMNPPFSAAGARGTANTNEVGYRHVLQALRRLQDGGRLVAILGEGSTLQAPQARDFWQKVRDRAMVRANVGINGKEYAKYGTTFGNRLIVIDKVPALSTAVKTPLVTGDFDTLEDAWRALAPVAADRPALPSATQGLQKQPGAGVGHGAEGSGGRLGTGSATGGVREPGGQPGTAVRGGRSGGVTTPGGHEAGHGIKGAPGGEPELRPENAAGTNGPVRGGDAAVGATGPAQSQLVESGEDIGDYVAYTPTVVPPEWGAKPHNAIIVETQTMASVREPPLTMKPNIPQEVISSGDLSAVQLATIAHAIQAHELFSKNGRRLGFFSGDGTGLGKGRENAGLAVHYWRTLPEGKRRTVWVSYNEELAEAARDDLDNVGGKQIPIYSLEKVKVGKTIPYKDGVLFVPYSKLAAQQVTKADGTSFKKGSTKAERAAGQKQMRRLQQIMDWAGEEPLIILDEVHKAKNATTTETEIPGQESGGQTRKAKQKPTATGLATIELQNKTPKARVLYSSATGFSDVSNMAYANRLDAWGEGTSFKDFEDFRSQVSKGGVGIMEMVARNLKLQGKYLSRFISYKGVKFEEKTHEISAEQHRMVDKAGDAWRMVIDRFNQAAEETTSNTDDSGGSKGSVKAAAMSQLYGAQLRFYRSLYTAMKVPTLIRLVDEAMDAKPGKSVVISVLETGQAQQDRELQRVMQQDDEDLEGADLSPIAGLINMVDSRFPTIEYETIEDPDTHEKITRPVKYIDDKGVERIRQNAEALKAKKELLDQLEKLKGEFPDAALDQIINKYGSQAVAEMTKRSERLIRNSQTGKREVQSRGSDLTKNNLHEMQAFQDGKKRIAIISNAASTGISLHSSIRAKNQQQRVHIMLQLKWSADMTMQDLGRTHRTAQVIPPEYVLLSLNVEAEKRFAATIARRLEQLGALSRGERKAGGGATDFSKYNFESKYGTFAVDQLVDTLFGGNDRFGFLNEQRMAKYPALTDGPHVLDMLGLHETDKDGNEVAPNVPVKRFFNRMMILPINMGNQLFQAFFETMEHLIDRSKTLGQFDAGAEKIQAKHLDQDGEPIVVHEDPTTKAQAVYYKLNGRNPRYRYSWDDARAKILSGNQDLLRVKASGRLLSAGGATTEFDSDTGAQRRVVWASGASGSGMRLYEDQIGPDEKQKYELIPPAELDAQGIPAEWQAQYDAAGPWISTAHHLITGDALSIWNKIQEREGSGKNETAKPLQVKIGQLDNGSRLIGVDVAPHRINQVLKGLGHEVVAKPEEVGRQVMAGKKFNLSQGATLRRSKVSGDYRMELEGAKHFARLFPQWGLFPETIAAKERWFIPTGDRGADVLKRVLKEMPVTGSEGEAESAPTSTARPQAQTASEAGTAVHPKFSSEQGSVVNPFDTPQIRKLAQNAAGAMTAGSREIKVIFAPASLAPETKLTVRNRAADLARASAIAEAALEKARKALNAMPVSERWDFYDRSEKGEQQATPALQVISNIFHGLLEASRKDVQDLGTGKLENFIENYLPHAYKDPVQAEKIFKEYFAKRPLEGSKAFLKRRKFETIKDAMDAGLEPISDNPVDLIILKVREMQKYVMAHRILHDEKAEGRLQFVRATEKAPVDWAKIDDKVGTVYGTPSIDVTHPALLQSQVGQAGGAMGPDTTGTQYMGTKTEAVHVPGIRIMGHWYAPADSARLINNYLSPGLRGSALFRGYLGLANSMNQFQLGFSAFHLGFTTVDAAVSKFALGIYQAAHGHPVQGLVSALQTPIAPFTGIVRGDKMLKEYYKPGSQGAQLATIVDAMVMAGGRAHMDAFYRTQITKKMLDSFRAGGWRYVSGALRLPFAVAEQAARPILEWAVPRQKMAVFADLAEFELQRLSEGKIDGAEFHAAIARAWDSVDNRMGQLVYDNLFWNKTVKDLAMGSVRSVGWNLGTIREVLGGAADLTELANTKSGPGGSKWSPEVTTRLSYLIALPLVVGMIGALIHALATGEHPKDLKDYYFPRSGPRGTPGWNKRWSLPSYVKDIAHVMKKGAWDTAKGKLHPILTLIAEMLSNKDYFDHPIRNENDKFVKQLKDEAEFAAETYEPLAVKPPSGKHPSKLSPRDKALKFVGVMPAPAYMQDGYHPPKAPKQHVPAF